MKLPPLERVCAATSTSLPRHRKKSSRRYTNTTNKRCSTSPRSCPSCIGHRSEGDGGSTRSYSDRQRTASFLKAILPTDCVLASLRQDVRSALRSAGRRGSTLFHNR